SPHRTLADLVAFGRANPGKLTYSTLGPGSVEHLKMAQIEKAGGAFVLAALKVPEADYERVAAAVNALPEVAHNYRREHAFNMWFVLATETPEGIAAAIDRIEAATGLPVFAFPKEREYFVEMKLHA
ncbi:MAG: tripartite tricarboxylate transporter substrate-binding protein, partial [Rhodocyclaceae bacterium]|nr:tripartite tricarboxylate transporter substrate-binding protein [Rhodocyclaceae bacterium]